MIWAGFACHLAEPSFVAQASKELLQKLQMRWAPSLPPFQLTIRKGNARQLVRSIYNSDD